MFSYIVNNICHSFLSLRFKQAAVEKRLKGVGKYGICFPHFFSPEKVSSPVLFPSGTLPSPSFCLQGALHDDIKNDWIASPPESLLA